MSASGKVNSSKPVYVRPPIQEASLWRKVRHVVSRFFGDVQFTIGSYFCRSIKLTENQTEQLPTVGVEDGTNQTKRKAIKQLKTKGNVGPSAVSEYLSYLQETHNDFGYVADFMHPALGSSDTPFNISQSSMFSKNASDEEGDGKGTKLPNKIAVPVVLGGTRDHVVVFFVDREENTIEFYDPKGMTLNDRAHASLIKDPNLTLVDVMDQIVEATGLDNPTVYENTSKHQKDAHNCGVFVSRYVDLRVDNNMSAEDVLNTPADSIKANTAYRAYMINQLFDHWSS